jgi:DNA-binding Lrp family transcriptional regulator
MLDPIDRAIIQATQAGLPLTPQPYHALAGEIGVAPAELMQRMQAMLDSGIIRRIGAVPNHYALGFRANGMSVWDIADEDIDELGTMVGGLEFVTHCYHRPRCLPEWPYSLFAMVHGHSRQEVEDQVRQIADMLGSRQRGHRILYSSRILKKTGLRLIG